MGWEICGAVRGERLPIARKAPTAAAINPRASQTTALLGLRARRGGLLVEVPEDSTGARKRYPRPCSVSMYVGFRAESPSVCRSLLTAG